jgi:hypothetical protein
MENQIEEGESSISCLENLVVCDAFIFFVTSVINIVDSVFDFNFVKNLPFVEGEAYE